MSKDSVFTKIIKGELPCYKVYENDNVLAFMDINPIQLGHVTVVSKRQVDKIYDLPQAEYAALMEVVRVLAVRMQAQFPDKRIGVQVEGLEVPHAHVKVFPFATSQQYLQQEMPGNPGADALERQARALAW